MRDRDVKLRTWDAWREVHQPFELGWWQDAIKRGHCSDPGWTAAWQPALDFIRASGDIIDIGCGPRPRFVPSAVIEPLASEYQRITPEDWWDAIEVHAEPAERFIAGISADTVICWNCLDHAIGWRDILDNMLAYGRANARFAVATDFHSAHRGHPGFSFDEFMNEIKRRFVVEESRPRQYAFDRDLSLVMRAKSERVET